MNPLPELGVGTIWFPGLDPLIEASEPLVDFLEVEPAVTTLPGGETVGETSALEVLAADGRPIVAHGITCPVGGTIAPAADDMARIAGAAQTVNAPWVSDHLSLNQLRYPNGEVNYTSFFLPALQTPETVEIVSDNLRLLSAAVGRPIAFETGVNYLRPQPGEMTDGAFWAAVAEAADCYILCDLHNLWCNEVNGRQSLASVINQLPLERICEIHLAAGGEHDGYMLDAHSGLVEPALMRTARQVIERLPALRALTFELMPAYLPLGDINETNYRNQFVALQQIWDQRAAKAGRNMPDDDAFARTYPGERNQDMTPTDWEAALVAALGTGAPKASASQAAITDPGIDIYRYLIHKMRSGAVVGAVPLSYRMLALSLGPDTANQILADYRDTNPPTPWAIDEGLSFARYLADRAPNVPYLLDVVEFEIAAHEVLISGEPTEVVFGCDPNPLLDALRNGKKPPCMPREPHVVAVQR